MGEAVISCQVASIFKIFNIQYSIFKIGRGSKIMLNCFNIWDIRYSKLNIQYSRLGEAVKLYWITLIFEIFNIQNSKFEQVVKSGRVASIMRYSIFDIQYLRLGEAVKSCWVSLIFKIFDIFDIWYLVYEIGKGG